MTSIALSITVGILTSLAWGYLILAQWSGFEWCLRRQKLLRIPTPTIAVWLGFQGLAALVLKAIPPSFWIYLGFSLTFTLLGVPAVWRWVRKERLYVGIYFLGCLLWSIWLRDVDGLTQSEDGVVHTLFMERIWEFKRFPLFDQLLPFSDIFSPSHFLFYPQLTHLIGVSIGLPLRALSWGVSTLTAAQIAKGSLIALCAVCLPWAFRWARQAVHPNAWAIPTAVLLFTASYFRFPIATVDQGGWSRMVGMFFVVAWAKERNSHHLSTWDFGAITFTSYLMHPQAAALALLFGLSQVPWHPKAILSLIFPCLTLAAAYKGFTAPEGYSVSVSILRGATQTHLEQIPAALWSFFHNAVAGEHYSHLLLRKAALVIGAMYMLLSNAPAIWRKQTTLWIAAGVILSACSMIAHPLARLAGAPFYHEEGRIAEMFWSLLPTTWAVGLNSIWRWGQNLSYNKLSTKLILAVAALFALSEMGWKWPRSLIGLQGHLDFYNHKYHSPLISKTGDQITSLDQIAQKSQHPLLLIAAPFVADSFPFRMHHKGAQSLFVYGECPFGLQNPFQNKGCTERRDAWAAHKIPQELLNRFTPVYFDQNGIAQSSQVP